MFSQMSVIPWGWGREGNPHVTIIHSALDLNVQGPGAPLHQTCDMGTPSPWPTPLLVTSGGYHWRPVQTCSLNLTVQEHPPRY